MIIYTDGSCLANGRAHNQGGFGVAVFDDSQENLIEAYAKRENDTTNNRMELKAILYAFLKYGKKISDDDFAQDIPIVYSDSNYCVQTFNNWMFGWASKGWIKSDKKIPENLDLIQGYYNHYQDGYRIDLRKIKGHAGEEGNELADQLATGYISPEEAMRTYG